jgi:hypothetical protein
MLLKLIMIGEGVPDTELFLGASEIACVRSPPILKIAATPQPNAPKLDLDNVNNACSGQISAQGGVMPFTKLPPLLAEALAARGRDRAIGNAGMVRRDDDAQLRP